MCQLGLSTICLLLMCSLGVSRPKAQLVAHASPSAYEALIAPEGPGRNLSMVKWIDKQYANTNMTSRLLATQVVLEARNLDDVPLERADCAIPELCSVRLALEVSARALALARASLALQRTCRNQLEPYVAAGK